MSASAFQGFTVENLTPCSFIEQKANSASVSTKVVADKEMFPLQKGDVVFDAGSLLSLGGVKISAVGIVMVGKKRSTTIYVLEASQKHYHKAGSTYELSDWQTWVPKSDEKEYVVTVEQRAKADEALKAMRKRKREAKSGAKK